MEFLKNLWPTPFKIKRGNLVSFIVQLIIFLVICAVAAVLIGWLQEIAVIGFVFAILGSLMGIYSIVGIVLCVLVFLGIMR